MISPMCSQNCLSYSTGQKRSGRYQSIRTRMPECNVFSGNYPVRKPDARDRRASMKVDMDLPTLLGTYFLSKPEYKDKKDQFD